MIVDYFYAFGRVFTFTVGSMPRNVWNVSPGETDSRLVLVAKLLPKKIDTSSLARSR